MLKLFYITNNPEIARIAQDAGVDRIFVDMEYIGKEERQGGLDTVKNHHTIEDVKNVRQALTASELLVRVNPIHRNSFDEINRVIDAGADIIMLPMWKTPDEVREFIMLVGGRVRTMLLLETNEAYSCIEEALKLDGIDEIHIGLNDLHLSQGKHFLFELLTDGTVDRLARIFNEKNITFGFGGFGRVHQENLLPAENIIAEHYRLGSSMAILSRAFCNTSDTDSVDLIREAFVSGVRENKEYEKSLQDRDKQFFEEMHRDTIKIINGIVSGK